MAAISMVFRNTCRSLFKIHASLRPGKTYIHTTAVQQLFASDLLGLDDFKRQQAVLQNKVGDLQDEFRRRMSVYLETEENTVFTGDLKSMLYTASEEADLEIIEKMVARFRKQRQDIRFSDFVFGPVVMRMLHMLNKPDLAMDLFTQEPKSDGFFEQLSTFTVLMDLLFENERYDDVINIMSTVKDKQVGGYKYPADCFVLFSAACCKKNTREAYDLLLHDLKEASKDKINLSLRTYSYSVYLALKLGEPSTAMDILDSKSFTGKVAPVIQTNLKVLTLSHLGRLEDAIFELDCLLNQDGPDTRIHDVFEEVVEFLQSAVEEKGDKVLSHKMRELHRSLSENHHLNSQSLEEYMFSPIVRKRQVQDGYKNRRRSGAMGYHRTKHSFKQGLRYREDSQ